MKWALVMLNLLLIIYIALSQLFKQSMDVHKFLTNTNGYANF